MLKRKDPLKSFSWDKLYDRYNEMCKRTIDHDALYAFTPTPSTDLDLYWKILYQIKREQGISLGSYEAILRWKMYSSGPKINNSIRSSTAIQKTLQDKLNMFRDFPKMVTKDQKLVTDIIRRIKNAALFGTKLPVASAIGHFLYPDVVPLFDKMVLLAVGHSKEEINKKELNQNIDLYAEYVGFQWELCEKYSDVIRIFLNTPRRSDEFNESPVRAIDMALWVSRGGTERC